VVDCCVPLSDIASHQRLRSARRFLLTVPRHRRSTLGRRAFSVAGPTVGDAENAGVEFAGMENAGVEFAALNG